MLTSIPPSLGVVKHDQLVNQMEVTELKAFDAVWAEHKTDSGRLSFTARMEGLDPSPQKQ